MNRPPKTAYVLLWFPKPSETFVFAEVAGLRRLGLEVEVFTLYGPWKKALSRDMAAYDGPVKRLGLAGPPAIAISLTRWLVKRPQAALKALAPWLRPWRSLETAGEALWCVLGGFALADWCVRRGIEHIHADWADGPATAAWIASRLSGLPFSFTGRAHDIHPPDGALADKMAAASWVRADVAGVADYLGEQAPDQAPKVHLVRACRTIAEAEPAAPAFRSPYRLLAVGRMVDKKGFDVLLEACRRLVDDGLDLRLTLAGDGPRLNRLKARASRLGLEQRVSFAGFVPHHQVAALYRAADLFLAPSRITASGDRDGIPNVLVEAMALGLPVVATDVAGIGEVVRDRETGRLVPPEDPAALARAASEVLADRAGAMAMAQHGRALVLEMFDPEARARDLLALLAGAREPGGAA